MSRAAASVRGSPNSSRGDGQVQASFPERPGKAGCRRTCGRARQDPVRQASEAPGKVLGGARGGALGGSSPGTAGPDPGRRQKASELKQEPRDGDPSAPLQGGVSAGGGGRSGGGQGGWVPSGPGENACAGPSSPAVARSPRSFPRETGRLAPSRQGAVLLRPSRSAVPVPRPPRGQPGPGTGGHNSSEATVTPGGSSCPCTSNSSRVWKTQDPRWPWEQVQSELPSWEATRK